MFLDFNNKKLNLIYGVSIDKSEQDEMFLDFNKEQTKIELPELIVQNRSRTNESDAAKHSNHMQKDQKNHG